MADTIFPPGGLSAATSHWPAHERLLGSAPTGGGVDQMPPRELQQACREFESVFIAYLLKEMRATVDKSGLIDGGPSEELYQSMMDTQVARNLSSTGGFGLAEMLFQQLSGNRPDGAGDSGMTAEETLPSGANRKRNLR